MVFWKNIAEESWSRLFHLHLCRSERRSPGPRGRRWPRERAPALTRGALLAPPRWVRPPSPEPAEGAGTSSAQTSARRERRTGAGASSKKQMRSQGKRNEGKE